MNILLVGDIVGKGGRQAVAELVPKLRQEYNCAYCIANGENAAGGGGLTRNTVEELLEAGIDVLTTGDHIWDQRDFVKQIAEFPRVLRPANLPASQPGRGYGIYNIPIGGQICVISLMGRVFMRPEADNPFVAVDEILGTIGKRAQIVVVDMHAEATSEKIAMGRHLDGRASIVFGTHTHVQTADETVFPGGTAYITDLGMVGARESILGRNIDAVLHKFTTGMPMRFKVVDRDVVLHGAVVTVDRNNGRATAVQRLVRDTP